MGRKGSKDNDDFFNETSGAVNQVEATDEKGQLIDGIHDVQIDGDKEIALVLYKNDYTYCWVPVQNLRNADVLLEAHRKQLQDWNKREVIRTSQEKHVDQETQESGSLGLNNENLTKDSVVNHPHQQPESPEICSSNQSIDKIEKSKGKKRVHDDDESQQNVVAKRRVGRPKKVLLISVSSSSKFDRLPSPDRVPSVDKATHEDSDGYDLWDAPATPEPLRDVLSAKSTNAEDLHNGIYIIIIRNCRTFIETSYFYITDEIDYSDDGHENDHDPWMMWNETDFFENMPELKSSEEKNDKKSPTAGSTLQPVSDRFSDLTVSSETTHTQNTSTEFTSLKSNTAYLDENYWKSQFPQQLSSESHSLQDYRSTYSHDYKKNDERQHDIIINTSASLTSSNESFDTSPTPPQFNKRRQDSFESSREGMASATYPLYTSPYFQYPPNNSLSQHGIYSSRASDYSSSQSICSPHIINTSSVGRNLNDDEMNIQKAIKIESIEDQLLTQWTGSLVKGQSAQYVGRVVVRPLKERCDSVDYINTIMNQHKLWMRNVLPQPYAERLVDPKDSIKYPIFLMDFIDDGNDNTRKTIETDLFGMKWNEIQSDSQTVAITQDPITQERLTDDLYYATQASILSNSYFALPELCKNNPRFGVFGPRENFEVREVIEAVKFFGGVHDQDFESPDLNPTMVKILYYIMTRIHNLSLTEFRHVILIQDDSEIELGVVDVPGVSLSYNA
ncbi:16862_t:CDS:10 [Racocetra fulgida]|uniref:16862_t:CDS:1 n=1 Tax=Racocetra fulgida TaxID=60492 RepID=A0A9N8ZZQ3_9GLOM|nr:16862_t:CDS:10 [Racocetra fulgida]